MGCPVCSCEAACPLTQAANIAASPAPCFLATLLMVQVLTDYAALPRIFHNIESAQVRWDQHSGGKHVVQTCKWAFLVFRWVACGRGACVW